MKKTVKVRPSVRRGFTLIELLIVIAIIGILASIVLVSLSSAREKAKIASFKASVHSMQTKAIEACDSGDINYIDVDGSFGTIPPVIDAINIVPGESDDCGPLGANTFSAEIPSAGLVTSCIATIQETGVTSWVGC